MSKLTNNEALKVQYSTILGAIKNALAWWESEFKNKPEDTEIPKIIEKYKTMVEAWEKVIADFD